VQHEILIKLTTLLRDVLHDIFSYGLDAADWAIIDVNFTALGSIMFAAFGGGGAAKWKPVVVFDGLGFSA
jgi:hypothetical protein